MQISVIGTGFVGVVTAAVLADHSHQVFGIDIDEQKIAQLQKSKVPFFEPGLSELLQKTIKQGQLQFTTNYADAVPESRVIFIAVGTPSASDGGVDLSYVLSAAESVAKHLSPGAIVVIKSTVPPGSFETIERTMQRKTAVPFVLASMPEFLREGSAVHDTQHPDRIVIGCDDPDAIEVLRQLHEPYNAPIEVVRVASAQMGKYAANAYLATRITFINHIADLCEKNGADVMEVIRVIGRDARIGDHYWYPGPGYGGSCFPKDVKELAHFSRKAGLSDNLFNALSSWNAERIPHMLEKFADEVGGWDNKRVALLGLSFKPHTDDTREAPAIHIIPNLLAAGATIVGYDPKATKAMSTIHPPTDQLTYTDSLTEAVKAADVIMVLIEWPEIVGFDYSSVRDDRSQWLIDWRNQLDPVQVKKWGFTYIGIGRG